MITASKAINHKKNGSWSHKCNINKARVELLLLVPAGLELGWSWWIEQKQCSTTEPSISENAFFHRVLHPLTDALSQESHYMHRAITAIFSSFQNYINFFS